MLDKTEVMERMNQGGELVITASYDTVDICGTASADAVIGSRGRVKLRAKFANGIKAVFDLGEYGARWQAETVQENTSGATA